MRRYRTLALVALLVFVLVVVARFPLAWANPVLPESFACQEPAGTVWSGRCATLALAGQQLGAVQWTLHPLPLLRGRLAARVQVRRGADLVAGEVAVASGGRVWARDLGVALDLAVRWITQLPPNLRGTVRAQLESLELAGRRVVSLEGRVDARDLRNTANGMVLGSYTATFGTPPDESGNVIGELRDLGGPVAFTGTLTLTPEPGYAIEGLIATRGDSSSALAQQLRVLGTPDAQGRRAFSIAGTY